MEWGKKYINNSKKKANQQCDAAGGIQPLDEDGTNDQHNNILKI